MRRSDTCYVLAAGLSTGSQHVEILGMYELGVLLKHLLRGDREDLSVYLDKIFVETGERPLWKVSLQSVKSL